ncbi:MAG: YhgE/Pip family protein [Pseudobdellovibrio sp.]
MQSYIKSLKSEYALYLKYPILFGAFFVLILVPALYSTIYLSSIWDPYGNLKNLPVCFSNADKGTEYRGQSVKLGLDIENNLKTRQDFNYINTTSPEEQMAKIKAGECYFGVLIPQDFSEKALIGRHDQQAKLEIQLSEGNSFMASLVGKKFGSELGHHLNETLNQKRWEVLISKIDSSAAGMKQLKDGAMQLRDGAQKIDEGSGVLATKQAELAAGLVQIQQGTIKIKEGTNKLKTETAKIPIVGKKVSAGAEQIENGLEQLLNGTNKAVDGSKKLADGAAQLHEGSGKLYAGLNLMYQKIPSKIEKLDGDAEGLAASITTEMSISNNVNTNGAAFAPYFAALSLWVGAIMITFIFQLQHIPEVSRQQSQLKKLFLKFSLAKPILIFQSLVLTLALRFILDIQMPFFTFWFMGIMSSLTFFAIVLMLVTILGDVGRVVALIFLIFQLGAAGGAFPVELSGGVFAKLHPYLPITEAVKAFRAILFGTYNGEWSNYLLKLIIIFTVVFAVCWAAGRRWIIKADADYKPAINV